MIFTERTITVVNDSATINKPLILYRGDKNIELKITIAESQFKFRNTDASNVIETTDASYAQLVINTPYNSPIFSDVAATKNGAVIFVITEAMIDEIREVGAYEIQIRLLDDNKQSRASIPPVSNAIEIREPIAIEDGSAVDSNVVNVAKVNRALTTTSAPLEAFDSQGNYIKKTWGDGDPITDAALNKMEAGIDGVNKKIGNVRSQIRAKANLTDTQNIQQQVNNLVLGAVGDGNNAEVIQARGKYDVLNSRFENIENNIDLLFEDTYELKNLIFDRNRTTVEQKFVNGSGTIVTSSSTLARYIEVTVIPGKPLYVSGTTNPYKVSKAHMGQIQILDADKNALVVVNETTSTDKVTCSLSEIPSNAVYLRINTAYNGNDFVGNLYVGYSPFEEKYLSEENAYEKIESIDVPMTVCPNRLYGKKIVAIGDSMVAGNGVAEQDLWLTKIATRNNMTYVNYGINGSFLSRKPGLVDGCNGVCDRMTEMDDDADYIVVYAGTNDAGQSVTIGDENATSKEEFIGAVRQTCKQLLAKYPTGKIMFITPYRKYSTFLSYIEAIENTCCKYGIPVFNNYRNGGICWEISAQTNLLTQGDNTHLNAAGHEFVSYKFEDMLRRL